MPCGWQDDEEMAGRAIPRADVAEAALQALLQPAARGRSMDLASLDEGAGAPTQDWEALFHGAKLGM